MMKTGITFAVLTVTAIAQSGTEASGPDGMPNKPSVESSETCPEIMECPIDTWYFNRLACRCFNSMTCASICPEGMKNSPDAVCSCQTTEYIRGLYPSSATDEMIKLSQDFDIQTMSGSGPSAEAQRFCSMVEGDKTEEAPADFDWGQCAAFSGLRPH